MYTQCPQCLTVFLVDASILAAGRGDARCGQCGTLFSTLDALADEPPGDGIITPTFPADKPPVVTRPEVDGEPSLAVEDEERLLDQVGDEESLAIRAEEPVDTAFELRAFAPGEVPDELLPAPPRSGPRGAGPAWWFAGALLALAFVGQVAWFEREALLQDPRARSLLDRLCEPIGCRLPLPRDLSQISLASRDIRAHPSVEGALIINATLRNEADFRQAYPDVVIRLSDLQGRPVAARRFTATEYLERPALAAQGFAPSTLVPLVFEVVDPGDEAVAFEFDFL